MYCAVLICLPPMRNMTCSFNLDVDISDIKKKHQKKKVFRKYKTTLFLAKQSTK